MTDELKPCPFCGGEAHMTETSHTKSGDLAGASVQVSWSRTTATYAVSCDKCDIGMTNPYLKADDAIAAWNRRADHIVDPNKMAAEPAGDIEKQISAIIFEHVDFVPEDGGTTVTGVGSAARAVIALFQPQMEAAEGLLRAAEAASAFAGAQPASMDQIAKRDAALQDLAVAAAQYRATGLGRESHD